MNQFLLLVIAVLIVSCHSKIKERKEEVYSRHLQKHISLTIISTPPPKNKSDFNLLLLNDGRNMKDEGVMEILDSIYRKKMISPLLIVGINAFDARQEYGISGYTDGKDKGGLASKYADFIVNELLPFVKKKSGIRSFHTVSIAGSGMAGVSAIDIAWDNWQKFDKVGFLPGVANSSSKVDFSILAEKISKSRKRPRIQFWLSQTDDIKNLQNDSTSMEHFFEVLKMKVQGPSVTRAGIESDQDRANSFSDSFSQFLIWLNEKN